MTLVVVHVVHELKDSPFVTAFHESLSLPDLFHKECRGHVEGLKGLYKTLMLLTATMPFVQLRITSISTRCHNNFFGSEIQSECHIPSMAALTERSRPRTTCSQFTGIISRHLLHNCMAQLQHLVIAWKLFVFANALPLSMHLQEHVGSHNDDRHGQIYSCPFSSISCRGRQDNELTRVQQLQHAENF